MTNITELTQSLKAAATNVKETAHIARYLKATIARQTFKELMTPDNILALVEALEKAQRVDEELCKLLPLGAEYMDPPDGGNVTPLEGVRRMVADYRQRIAELESRAVKLPPKVDSSNIPFAGHTWNCCLDEVEKRLANAGIKVETE
ncbi:hypothetical protein AH0331V1_1768 [Klebsiella pneumoniae]|nr:hypothetical protein AH0331V1_1768 [Klebsiella pneumoniae]